MKDIYSSLHGVLTHTLSIILAGLAWNFILIHLARGKVIGIKGGRNGKTFGDGVMGYSVRFAEPRTCMPT